MASRDTYDYIIVGAGSAGCVLASRLSEDPDVQVLVVEAGGPDALDSIHVPIAFGQLFKTAVDWDYSTAPEPMCNGRRIYQPRGKTLGGCSSPTMAIAKKAADVIRGVTTAAAPAGTLVGRNR
jgi:choline dehydrogenase